MFRRGLARVATVIVLGCAPMTACATSSPSDDARRPDAAALERDIDEQLALDPDHDRLRALLVHARGEPVLELYRGTDDTAHWDVDAVTMSVVSTLVGIALHDGLIDSLDATVGELLPRHRESMRPVVARITLEELLTMRGSLAVGDIETSVGHLVHPDPVASIGGRAPVRRHSGFEIALENAHLLAAVLAEATGTSVLDYARTHLFDPLGIETRPAREDRVASAVDTDLRDFRAADFGWLTDEAGVHVGWGGLRLRPADLVRLGQLFLDGGRWEGRQIVPASWVERATTRQVAVSRGVSDDYGYHWWVGDSDSYPTFIAWGFGGQLLQVIPDLELVVVAASEVDPVGPPGQGLSARVLTFLVSDVIVPAVGG